MVNFCDEVACPVKKGLLYNIYLEILYTSDFWKLIMEWIKPQSKYYND